MQAQVARNGFIFIPTSTSYLIESRGQGSKRPLDKTWTRDEGRAITWVTLAGKVALVQTVPWLRSVGRR